MREKLIKLLDDALLSVEWDSYDYPDTDSAADILIANDVVPVVRCKDCKWRQQDDANRNFCGLGDFYCGDTDFCSRGERKYNG